MANPTPRAPLNIELRPQVRAAWTWIKGDNPVKPSPKAELELQHRMERIWTWIKGDNPVTPKRQRRVIRAGMGVRNKDGKLLEKLRTNMGEKILNMKRLVRKLKSTKSKKVVADAEGDDSDQDRRDRGAEVHTVDGVPVVMPHAQAASEVSSLSSRGAPEGEHDDNDDDGPPPPDYTSIV